MPPARIHEVPVSRLQACLADTGWDVSCGRAWPELRVPDVSIWKPLGMALPGRSSEYSVFPSSVALGLADPVLADPVLADTVLTDVGPAGAEVGIAGLLVASDAFPPVLQPTAASTSKPLEHPSRLLRHRCIGRDGSRRQPPAAALWD
jgi:hypothetical protein